MEKFRTGLFAEAMQDFKTYLGQNPAPALAGDAYYYMGESLLALPPDRAAIQTYDTVVKKYKDSAKVAEALYKEGLSFVKMGDRETGELIWQQLIKDHPDSEAAGKAKEGMKNPGAGRGRADPCGVYFLSRIADGWCVCGDARGYESIRSGDKFMRMNERGFDEDQIL
jgi:tol-pal system protein YbgF